MQCGDIIYGNFLKIAMLAKDAARRCLRSDGRLRASPCICRIGEITAKSWRVKLSAQAGKALENACF